MSNKNMFDPNVEQVSGPINVIRLEGTVHGIPKVIYLFADLHMPPAKQTQCSNVYSQNISKYFAENFYELNDSDIVYDFFLEIDPSFARINRDDDQIFERERYLSQLRKFFSNIFKQIN